MLEGITTTLDGDYDELIERFFDEEWSDGLPVVLPTEARVAAMLGDREPGKIYGPVTPIGGVGHCRHRWTTPLRLNLSEREILS